MRPVRATSTILRMISSTRLSSTHSVISTLGRKASEYSLSAVLVEIALLPAVAFDLANAARFERGALQSFQDLFGQKRFDDGDDLLHRTTLDSGRDRNGKPAS